MSFFACARLACLSLTEFIWMSDIFMAWLQALRLTGI
jgi:hypothetical protein